QGEVIYNANTPADIENAYTINELLEMEETDKAGDFTVELYYDEWMTYAYYFLFGYEEMEKEQLKSWHDQFSKAGKIDSEAMSDLEKQLKPENASVEIYKEGQLIQSAGDKLEEDSGKMNILASIHSPDKKKKHLRIQMKKMTQHGSIAYQTKTTVKKAYRFLTLNFRCCWSLYSSVYL